MKRLDKSDIIRRQHVTFVRARPRLLLFCENVNKTQQNVTLCCSYVRREIETHARLRHPCVVQMMRFFEDG